MAFRDIRIEFENFCRSLGMRNASDLTQASSSGDAEKWEILSCWNILTLFKSRCVGGEMCERDINVSKNRLLAWDHGLDGDTNH